ncbi:ATP-binding protein [Candidatus Bathyarchaeota archaeon]|nr:ATP-binding protein [Candidatus Bathyarchaeota archaeon]
MSTLAEPERFFTDLDGRFSARLSAVIPVRKAETPSETTGITAKYDCRIKAEYQKDLMGLLEEGMLLAVRNFKSGRCGGRRYTLLEISRIGPEHYGLTGLSDHSYYPYQFEIIQQSVEDWATDDKATMMIQMSAIPLNYDLVAGDDDEAQYIRGFTYPVIAETVHILNRDTIHQMYNKSVLERMGRPWRKIETSPSAREDPRLGTIKMFESEKERIPIYVDFERLVRYHFGIFAFTGAGKSNLLSNILRRLVYHTKDTKVVIFDISMEYPFFLQDVFADLDIPAKVVLETPVQDADQFYKIVVKPRGFEKAARAKKAFEEILRQGKVGYYKEEASTTITYGDIFEQLKLLRAENAERATSLEAINAIEKTIRGYMREKKHNLEKPVDEAFIDHLSRKALEIVEKYKIWRSGGLYGWAQTRSQLKEELAQPPEEETSDEGYTKKALARLIEGDYRIICLSIVDPNIIKSLAIQLTNLTLIGRKREFKVEPPILFVFDEAQEFIPAYEKARGIERECTVQIETLLRQGRKYGLGGCLATQRIAYLNTNALQQLHTYFIGPLPRPYDRSLVSNTFTIDQGILEKTLEFAPGEWLLSSYTATGMENVPIFIKADNSEAEIQQFLQL